MAASIEAIGRCVKRVVTKNSDGDIQNPTFILLETHITTTSTDLQTAFMMINGHMLPFYTITTEVITSFN